jgi:nucleotide-binding universal stress UspA family protein
VIGKPAEEILKEADKGAYDLIVMGRKGRTAVKELLLGGVSSTVLERSTNATIVLVSTQ